jgi:hypothetical protein
VALSAKAPSANSSHCGGHTRCRYRAGDLVAEPLAAGRLEPVLQEWSAEGESISTVYPAVLRDLPKMRVFA